MKESNWGGVDPSWIVEAQRKNNNNNDKKKKEEEKKKKKKKKKKKFQTYFVWKMLQFSICTVSSELTQAVPPNSFLHGVQKCLK